MPQNYQITHELAMTIVRHLTLMTDRKVNVCGATYSLDPEANSIYNYRWCPDCLAKAKR